MRYNCTITNWPTWVKPGQIIQMRLAGGMTTGDGEKLHTAVIEWVNFGANQMGFIESNYYGDNVIRRRTVDTSYFSTMEAWTVYQIK